MLLLRPGDIKHLDHLKDRLDRVDGHVPRSAGREFSKRPEICKENKATWGAIAAAPIVVGSERQAPERACRAETTNDFHTRRDGTTRGGIVFESRGPLMDHGQNSCHVWTQLISWVLARPRSSEANTRRRSRFE